MRNAAKTHMNGLANKFNAAVSSTQAGLSRLNTHWQSVYSNLRSGAIAAFGVDHTTPRSATWRVIVSRP